MTLLFLSLAGIIAIVVILVSAKFIKAGFDARSEVKEEQRKEKLKQEDEDILDELKRKDLSEKDLKDLYDCLLYTSPSPRDSCASRMPSSA